MQIREVDPRDQTQEVDDPKYRVIFWGRIDDVAALCSDEWELSETDVLGVLSWASANADGRSVSVWVAYRNGDDLIQIRLAGIDPTASSETWPSWGSVLVL